VARRQRDNVIAQLTVLQYGSVPHIISRSLARQPVIVFFFGYLAEEEDA